jgi:hypothetical protein
LEFRPVLKIALGIQYTRIRFLYCKIVQSAKLKMKGKVF